MELAGEGVWAQGGCTGERCRWGPTWLIMGLRQSGTITFAASLSLILNLKLRPWAKAGKRQVIIDNSTAKQFKPPPSWPHEIAWVYTHAELYFML